MMRGKLWVANVENWVSRIRHKVNINQKVNVLIIMGLLVSGGLAIGISAYTLEKRSQKEISDFRAVLTQEKRKTLKSTRRILRT